MKKKTQQFKKVKPLDVVMFLFLLVGIGILAYPFVQDRLNDFLDQQIIGQYQRNANQENKRELEKLKAEMMQKNQQLAETGNNPGVDSFNQAVAENEEHQKNEQKQTDYYTEHTIGVIHIPKIKASLPIFDQTNDLFLQKGASLLEGTSFPVGGESTHSVISAHRGLPEATLFTDLPKLVKGDTFFIELNNEKHAYQVAEIRIVEPTDTEHLVIEKGKDLVTLLTCTPYMINTHRLLVTGTRIPYVPEKDDPKIEEISTWKKLLTALWIIGACFGLGVIGFLVYRWRKVVLKTN